MNHNTLNFETANITGGYYDNGTGILTLLDNHGITGYNPIGQVNILDKSVSGTFTGPAINGYSFSITYHGQH